MSLVTSNPLALIRRRSEPADPTLPAIIEFQWPSTAIVNAPIPRSARGLVWIIASMMVIMIAAMALIPIDQVVAARGVVISQSPTVLVQPLDTAIVRSIDVREGQQVKAGALLARLDPTFAAADLAALEAQFGSLEAEVARLSAEAESKPFSYTGTDPNWILQAAIYGHRKAQFDAKVDSYDHRIDELSAVTARAHTDAAAYRERLGLAQNIEQIRKKLEAAQAGSKLDTFLATDSRLEISRALASAEKTAYGSERDQASLMAERDAFIRGWRAETSQNLSQVTNRASDAREQLNKAKLRRQLVELRSENDAIVQSVAKVSVGSVMQSGQQFITLIPLDSAFEVEANIPARENGFVHVQDQVSIKFDTFPYSRYGMAKGSVRSVSPDSFTAQSEARNPTSTVPVTATEPYYRSRISIDLVAMHDVPGGFQLIPGMPVMADIKVGKRTPLGYLLGAMMPLAQEGMREP
jgi:HlyD family secretion protein